MSREIRRVPVGWQHPTEPNPYWLEQRAGRIRRGDPEPRLHAPDVRYVSLSGDMASAMAGWREDVEAIAGRTGWHWTFSVAYHLTGYEGLEDNEPTVHPFYVDGYPDAPVTVRDEDHLQELEAAQVAKQKPNPAHYMPAFEGDPDTFGWCLYETVSEGSPVTPMFATASELIDHLVEVGEDWDQSPYRREAAGALVSQGSSLGSFVDIGGKFLDSSRDADLIGGASS